MSSKSSERFTLRSGLVVEEIDEEVVILDLAGDRYFSLNPVGLFIWRTLEEGATSLDEVVTRVIESFKVDDHLARRDAISFIDALRTANLVEVESS